MGEAELTRFFQAPAATAAGGIDGPQAKSLYIFVQIHNFFHHGHGCFECPIG